jgi:hypothetical protein
LFKKYINSTFRWSFNLDLTIRPLLIPTNFFNSNKIIVKKMKSYILNLLTLIILVAIFS